MLVGTFGLSYMVAMSTLETNPEIAHSAILDSHLLYNEEPDYPSNDLDII
jgi:hypothetical protein